jgi:CRISPR/Cas system-associated exonuclease Cas4 (RecB family)
VETLNLSTPTSYTAINQYLRCPLQYWFQRVLGIPPRSTPAPLALGAVLHEALAHYHRSLQQGRPMVPVSVLNAFHTAWTERKRWDLITYPRGTEPGHVEQGTALIEAYLQQPPPENIVGVEQEIVVPLINTRGEVMARELVAVLDLLTRDDAGKLVVTDIKTSSRSYSDMDAALSIQPTAYVHAAQEQYAEDAAFRFLVLVKTKKVKIQSVPATRTLPDIARLGDLVQVIDHAVDHGVFYPIESPHNCSTCSYRRPCREWQSDQSHPPPPDDRINLPTVDPPHAA